MLIKEAEFIVQVSPSLLVAGTRKQKSLSAAAAVSVFSETNDCDFKRVSCT